MAFYFDTFLRIKKGVLSEINVKTSTMTYKAIITQKRKKKDVSQCQVTPQGTQKVVTNKVLTAQIN